METRVSLLIQNHLNNVMFDMDINEEIFQERAKESLRFVKYLVHMFPDTNVKIDVEVKIGRASCRERVLEAV
jgi:hypothetical protein